jgi:DNA-binding transcriptional MocR family regulator
MDWVPTISDRTGPLYLRIVGALSDDIAAGRLHDGQMLPTHRTLAAALGVDLTTVTRAYSEARRLGLTDARVGRGTFVKAGRDAHRRASPVPTIDLSMNIPPQPADADLSAQLAKAFGAVRAEAGLESYLNYQQPGGTRAERAIAAEWLKFLVPDVPVERLVIAPGTQSALFALLMLLVPRGGAVFTEALSYPGLKSAAGLLGIRLIGAKMDAQGIVPDALELACREHPDVNVVYLMPTMHNPTTATMPPERREKIARIIRRHGLLLIEDDPYAFLTSGIVPLAELIPERTHLAASLSKCVTPGLRASFIVTPGKEASANLINALRATLQMPATFATAMAVRWLRDGTADRIIASVRAEAKARQKLAREALEGSFYMADPHGHHLWLPMPATWSDARLAAHLENRGLGVVTADAFAVGEPARGVRIALGAARNRTTLGRALDILRETLATGSYDNQVV